MKYDSNISHSAFDLCGTLVSENTTFGFVVYYYYRKRNWYKYIKARAMLSFPIKILMFLVNRVGIPFSGRNYYLGMLRGESKRDITEIAIDYAAILKEKYLNDCVYERFQKAKKNGHQITILSASIEPVVSAFSQIIGSDNDYSTKLRYDNEGFIGFLHPEDDTQGNKSQFIKIDCYNFFATDNMDDRDIISISNKCLIVTKKKNLEKWKVIISEISAEEKVEYYVKK